MRLAVAALAAAAVAAPAQAYDVRGVGLGASEEGVRARFPQAQCRPMEWQSAAADRRCDDPKVELGGVAARVTFYLKGGAVQAFDVRFDVKDTERLAAHLKARYGAPAAETREPLPARGERPPREVYRLQWRKGEARAVLTAIKDRRRGSFTVSRGDFEEEIYRVR